MGFTRGYSLGEEAGWRDGMFIRRIVSFYWFNLAMRLRCVAN